MPVRINYHLCKGCKSCYNECPADVFGWDMDKEMPYLAYPDECWHCGICKLECPANALEHTLPPQCWIDINKRYLGNLSVSREVRIPGKE